MPFDVEVKTIHRLQFLTLVRDHFATQTEQTFNAVQISGLRQSEFEAMQIEDGTVFSELQTFARANGLAPNGTFGGLTAITGIHQGDAHDIGCVCLGKQAVTGKELVTRITRIIETG